jgi:hypothetical protein
VFLFHGDTVGTGPLLELPDHLLLDLSDNQLVQDGLLILNAINAINPGTVRREIQWGRALSRLRVRTSTSPMVDGLYGTQPYLSPRWGW